MKKKNRNNKQNIDLITNRLYRHQREYDNFRNSIIDIFDLYNQPGGEVKESYETPTREVVNKIDERLFKIEAQTEELDTIIRLLLSKLGYRFIPSQFKQTKPKLLKDKKRRIRGGW